MTDAPTLDDILAVMTAAAGGDTTARVRLPDTLPADDLSLRLAPAINHLLAQVAERAAASAGALQAAQQELARVVADHQTQLRESEEKFSKAFRASPAAMSIASLPDGRWLDINDAMVALTGYTRAESLGRTSAELKLVDAEARAAIIEAIRQHGIVRNVEIQAHTKTGALVDVLVSVEQIEINGQPCALTLQLDITERKRAERDVRRLNADLEQRQAALESANTELEAFSYSVAHDLRAPLRSIDGFSQVLLEDYVDKLDAEGQHSLRRVRAAAQQMGRLIDDLLMLARVTRTELRREPVDLTALAREVLDRWQLAEPARRAEIVIAPGLTADSDAHLLSVLLENLLGNAWKFTSKAPQTRIEVGALPQNGGTIFFVRDNGAGFDMAYAGQLFTVFQRLHSSQDYAGTGVGLAIVQRIIRRLGGRVWAEAAVDQGATFYFTLSS